ncbi:MAG: hypothetical protein ABFC73_10060 [Clostridiaceae bacterium]
MEKYKSWSDLQKLLNDRLCPELRGRISYFLTRYHDVHNAYGRAAVRLDGKELVCFSWIEQYHQDEAIAKAMRQQPESEYEQVRENLKSEWNKDCTYCEMDFLNAALRFRSMPIQDALRSENAIIRALGILDRRVGSRTLRRIGTEKTFENEPEWVRQFYEFRLKNSFVRKIGDAEIDEKP